MLDDIWPTFALRVTTARLSLRLPNEAELGQLARLAGSGIHGPDERPFLTPWTEGSPLDRAHGVLQAHWDQLANWQVQSWSLGLGVFAEADEPIGLIMLHARDFPVVREVATTSWLGVAYQGRGFGTEARAGALTLAFDHLHAEAALSEAFQDNHASQAVSRKLGYEPDGISRDARGDEALVSDRLRLTADNWRTTPRPSAEVTGLEACRHMFGV